VANPVDRDLFRPPSETERQGARARLGWGPGRAKVLFVGRLTEDKGVHVLLEARDEASYDLAFCGPGDPSILGPPTGGVEYLPPRPQRQLVSLYHAADALAVPSSAREAFPVVVQEALACGLPVVMSYEAGYAPYRALPGLIFCDREPVAMKRALRQALRRPRSAATDDLDAFCPDPATWLRAVYGAEIAEVDGRSTQRCQ
jgi:D-inositol-3-phosphate glycosyltransferase